jgi:hypothetical protein
MIPIPGRIIVIMTPFSFKYKRHLCVAQVFAENKFSFESYLKERIRNIF